MADRHTAVGVSTRGHGLARGSGRPRRGEPERTWQIARIGNNLIRIACWANISDSEAAPVEVIAHFGGSGEKPRPGNRF